MPYRRRYRRHRRGRFVRRGRRAKGRRPFRKYRRYRNPKTSFTMVKKYVISENQLVGGAPSAPGAAAYLPFHFQKVFQLNMLPAADLTAWFRLFDKIGIASVACKFTPVDYSSISNTNVRISTWFDPDADDTSLINSQTGDQILNRFGMKHSYWMNTNTKNFHNHFLRPRPLQNIYGGGGVLPDAYRPIGSKKAVMLDAQSASVNQVPHYGLSVCFTNIGDSVTDNLQEAFNMLCSYTITVVLQRPI